jgi:peptidoglycan/LPS O-acetylase OafA/YrhL
VAIAAILILHMAEVLVAGVGYTRVVAALYRLMCTGWLGVDVFFVLSGFLITRVLLEGRDHQDSSADSSLNSQNQSQSQSWFDFYLHRAVRIFPAFAAVFVVTIVVIHFCYPEAHLSWRILLPAIFFLENWTVLNGTYMPFLPHLWSLAIEEQFYLLWPQAARRLSNRSILALALSLAALCEVLRAGLAMKHVPAPIVYSITPTRIDGLALGAALAIGITMPRVRRFLARTWGWIALAAVAALAMAFIRLHGNLTAFDIRSQLLAIPPVVLLVAMSIYASVDSVLPTVLARILSNPALTYLGRRSYALYLIHYPIVAAVVMSRAGGYLARLPHGVAVNLLLIIGVLTIALLLTEASWRIIETPAQRLRQGWRKV